MSDENEEVEEVEIVFQNQAESEDIEHSDQDASSAETIDHEEFLQDVEDEDEDEDEDDEDEDENDEDEDDNDKDEDEDDEDEDEDDEDEDEDDEDEDDASEFTRPDQTPWRLTSLAQAHRSIRTWSTRWGVSQDPYVLGLSKAVESNSNMTMWASLDPYDRLPYADLKKGKFLARAAEALSFLRNVLVFLPVALTWHAISKATSKFGEYTKTVEGEVNFLDFWQSSEDLGEVFFGLVGANIQDVAHADFVIVAIIVALTLVSNVMGSISERLMDKEENSFEKERDRLALMLTDSLETKRSASPESIAGSIADVLNDLVDASHEVRSAAIQLEDASGGVSAFAIQINVLNERIETLTNQVALQLTGGVVQAVNDLGASVNQLNSAVGGDTSRILNEIIEGLDVVRAELGRTATSVEFGTMQLRQDLEEIAKQRGKGKGR